MLGKKVRLAALVALSTCALVAAVVVRRRAPSGVAAKALPVWTPAVAPPTLRADCPESGVLYGPWALRFDETHATVRWDACRPTVAALSVRPESGGPSRTVKASYRTADVRATYEGTPNVPPDRPGRYFTAEVAIDGLEPSTCYRYVLDGDPARAGRFCTARRPGEPFVILAMGDTNVSHGETQQLLTTVLGGRTFDTPPDFSLHLGDMQYYDQVVESYANWFPVMQPLLAAGALQPCIGNHEFERTHEFEDYYVRLFGGAGRDGPLEYYRFDSGGVWFFSLDSEFEMGPTSAQGKWFMENLADAASRPGYRFSVVFFHKPWVTLSVYPNAPELREAYRAAFTRYGVKLVLQGHVHGYERFVEDGVTYVVSGGGGAALHALDRTAATRPVEAGLRAARAERFHATLVKILPDRFEGRAVANDGNELDSFTVKLSR